MQQDLLKLINTIIQQYNLTSERWDNSEYFIKINQNKKLVKDINSEPEIMDSIWNYRKLLKEQLIYINNNMQKLNLSSEVTSRLKLRNSIEYKMNNYMSAKHQFGEIPLNKCFNDIFGMRIILKENANYETIKNFMKQYYSNQKIKFYDASKQDYVATHLYFYKENYDFRWELQIWDKQHEISNKISHEAYKQEYTKWEKEK